jgi:TusA-related sulfurtransferase
MTVGESVELLLDDGEPFENVTISVQEEGHKISTSELCDGGHHRVVIEKC